MKFSPGNAQHIGKRSEQQDSFGFSDPANGAFAAHGGIATVVADGMGGLANGSLASKTAVQAFLAAYAQKQSTESIPDALLRAIESANGAVFELSRKNGGPDGLGTTLAAAVLHNGSLYWVSAGDSRVYLYRNGEVAQLTADHNYAAELELQVAEGEVTRAQAIEHPERESLTSYLGLETLLKVDRSLKPYPIQPEDCVLICSDGLYRTLSPDEMESALQKDAHKTCEMLVKRAVQKGNKAQDNITAVALKCEEPKEVPSRLLTIAAFAALAILGMGLVWRTASPQIADFRADSQSIAAGQSATLHWAVIRGAVTIEPGIGTVQAATGSRIITPTANTEYKLVARTWLRSSTWTLMVNVKAPPAVRSETLAAPQALSQPVSDISFAANPASIRAGESTVLSWNVRKGATHIRIDPAVGKGELKSKDSRKAQPKSDTTYTLSARVDSNTKIARSITVTVIPPRNPPPRITSFAADKPRAKVGDEVSLNWSYTGAVDVVSIDHGVGVVTGNSKSVTADRTAVYTLTASGPGGKDSKNLRVVALAAPKIEKFEAEKQGDNWKLRWVITGTDEETKITITPDLGPQPASGEVTVTPTTRTDYVLSVTGPGGSDSKSQTVDPQQNAEQR